MTIKEIADALRSEAAQVYDEGMYFNRKGIAGQYLTVKCGKQWYMVSVSPMEEMPALPRWADPR